MDALFTRETISVVVPTFNEETRIVGHLQALCEHDIDDIIVVDGESADATVELAETVAKTSRLPIRVVRCERGRATQLNLGGQLATGRVLLFLHADVRLPPDAAALIRVALSKPARVGGAFRTRTVDETGRRRLGSLLRVADLRSQYTRRPYGDQAIFTYRSIFRAMGGFPPMALMEDLVFSRRLARMGVIEIIPRRVTVSGRRFIANPLLSTLIVNLYPALLSAGVSPETLSRFYRAVR